ncbi:hypothetical protein ACF1A9_32495 [Streptomyces sp. NPDC014872]|uniref:hypothetical protein n=1 Tax=Streptomyces sp. NPDC014872 TaxID=3364926 RepID=UPI0036F69718
MSDSDHSSRAPARAAPGTEPPAGPVLDSAAASPAAYNASTAQEAATALVRLLMEQMGFGPDDIAPGGPGPAHEPVCPSRAEKHIPGKSGPRGRETAWEEREERR